MNRHYWALWSLLATAFLLFFFLSATGSVRLGSLELVRPKFPIQFEPEATTETPIADEPVTDEPVADTTSQRILIMGDSMLEGLSPRLAAYAKHNNHKLFTVIWYSSSSKMWATSQNIEKYIAKFKPTFIFLCLGANELFIKNVAELREPYVRTVVEKLGDIPFVWIGPPNKQKDTGINDLLKKTIPSDKFFLTKGMKFSYFEDQIHPTRASAVVWMDSVVRWMPAHCKRQIKLDPPTIIKAKPDTLLVVKQTKK